MVCLAPPLFVSDQSIASYGCDYLLFCQNPISFIISSFQKSIGVRVCAIVTLTLIGAGAILFQTLTLKWKVQKHCSHLITVVGYSTYF